MRRSRALLLATSVVSGIAIAAASDLQTSPSKAAADKMLTLSGCVEPGDTEEQTILVRVPRAADGTKYRLSGANVKRYLGKRVRITGGLVPSANLAAQAGAVDPTQTAMAAQPGGGSAGTGTVVLEFRVRRIVPLKGDCPPK